jgi:hypothetical protein
MVIGLSSREFHERFCSFQIPAAIEFGVFFVCLIAVTIFAGRKISYTPRPRQEEFNGEG